jgi:hypothetical protein
MNAKDQILEEFKLFFAGTGGIDSWLGPDTPQQVFDRLANIDKTPLSRAQLTQLLVLSHEAGPSDGFFRYYWLAAPAHTYDVSRVPDYQPEWKAASSILSLAHLRWGLYRFYVDALLYFGSIRSSYRALREKSYDDLITFFATKCFDTNTLKGRGPALPMVPIAKDSRYLISEMACKSYAPLEKGNELANALTDSYRNHKKLGGGRVNVGQLLDGTYAKKTYADRHQQLLFSADELLEENVESEEMLIEKCNRIARVFDQAREAALKNTQYYLSMVVDLDVYVATSMRDRADFRAMADKCEEIFSAVPLSCTF